MNAKTAIAAALALFAAVLSGCATKGYNKGEYNLVSVEQEKEWGKTLKAEVDAELAQKGMLEAGPAINAYVDGLGRKLLQNAPEVNFDYTFTAVKTDTVNAFAVPGGHVYINTGLIAAADNEAELASVVSHEIGHVVARHGSERLSAIMTASIAGDILVSSVSGDVNRLLTDLAVQIATNTGGLAYSRANENEADRIGVEILYNSGYDPRAMQRFFQKLRESRGEVSDVEEFFSTHPDPADRRSRVRDFIQSVPLHDGLVLDTPEFQKVRAKCLEMHPQNNLD